MSKATTTDRINLRLSKADLGAMRVIAAAIQRQNGSPFVSQADTIREALQVASSKIVADGMREASVPR